MSITIIMTKTKIKDTKVAIANQVMNSPGSVLISKSFQTGVRGEVPHA